MAGTRARTARGRPAADRRRPDLGRRAGLRDPADAAVLDHPVAPLRLHDHQPGAARLRRQRRLAEPGAGRGAAAFRAALLRGRGGVRGQRDRLFRAGAARAVQSAGDSLGPAPAGATCWRSTCCWRCPSCAPAPACAWPFRGVAACSRASTASTSWAPGREASASWRCCSCCRRPGRIEGWIGALGLRRAAVAWLECGAPRRRWPAAALMALAGLPLLLPPSVGRAGHVALQGTVADPAHSRRAGGGGTVEPARAGQRGRESAHLRCAMRRA